MPSPRESQRAEWDELYLELTLAEVRELAARALRLLVRHAVSRPERVWRLAEAEGPELAVVMGGVG